MKHLSPILTDSERKRYNAIKSRVEKNNDAFWQMAEDLTEVKNDRLYREEYDDFEEFCQECVGVTPARVRQLTNAVRIKKLAEANGDPVPENERQARAYQQQKNGSDPEPPGVKVSDTTVSLLGDNEKPEPEKKLSLPKEFRDAAGLDEMGYPIPEAVIENFKKREELLKLCEVILGVKQHVLNSIKAQEKTFWWLTKTWTHEADSLAHGLKSIAPYAVCPYCQGRTFENCMFCGQTGVVGKFYYQHNVPEELRRLREIQINKLKHGAPA